MVSLLPLLLNILNGPPSHSTPSHLSHLISFINPLSMSEQSNVSQFDSSPTIHWVAFHCYVVQSNFPHGPWQHGWVDDEMER